MLPNKIWYSPNNVLEVVFKKIKDCCMGDHLGYQRQMILSILNVQTILLLSTKFQLMLVWENISFVDPDRGTGGLDSPPPEKITSYNIFLSKTGRDLLQKSQSYLAKIQ